MNKKIANNIRLGIFITLGIALFIGGIYFVGSRQNLFGSSTRVVTTFENVGGLQVGNNVRFSGITVGTVESIEIISSKLVKVTMIIEKSASKFIKKDAVALVGSEGLMGDKIISLTSGTEAAPTISDGDKLTSNEPVNMDDLMVTLQQAGSKAEILLTNLAGMSAKINKGEGTIGKLISDDQMYDELTSTLSSYRKSGKNVETITSDFAYLSSKTRNGEGSLGKLMVNESIYDGLEGMVDTLRVASKNAAVATDEIVSFSQQLNNKEGTVGRLLSDTIMATNINQTLTEISSAAVGIENTTNKINNSWFLNLLFGKNKNEESKFK